MPTGWKLVPIEPTAHQVEEMEILARTMIETVGKLDVTLIYGVALLAAPEAPKED